MSHSTHYPDLNSALIHQDFYAAVNGAWEAQAIIPSNQSQIGCSDDARDRIEHQLRADFDRLLASPATPVSPELATFLAYYRQARDDHQRAQDGVAPLRPYLDRLNALTSLADLPDLLTDWFNEGLPTPFSLTVAPDSHNPQQHVLTIGDPRLIFRTRQAYAPGDPTRHRLTPIFNHMARTLLQRVGYSSDQATTILHQATQFDATMAPVTQTTAERFDPKYADNPAPLAQVTATLPDFDLRRLFARLLPSQPDQLVIENPAGLRQLGRLLTPSRFDWIKGWLILWTVLAADQTLDASFHAVASEFNRALVGQATVASADQTAFHQATYLFDEVVGAYYGRRYFGPQAKRAVTRMVHHLIDGYRTRLAANDWLSKATRTQAIHKLDCLGVKVGYPDHLPALYARLTVDAHRSFFANTQAILRVFFQSDYFNLLDQPVDHSRWGLAGHIVNAYYDPQFNEIVFPAGILQAPLYTPHQSLSANYGGIGTIIAHEISHAFDNTGARYAADGTLTNWWTPRDLDRFNRRALRLVTAFDGVSLAGEHLDGRQTLAENIADAGGLSCALAALKQTPHPDLKTFFISYATAYRTKQTPAALHQQMLANVHAPGKLRVNCQVVNLTDFYTTFHIRPGDGMYVAPQDRVRLW